MELKLIYFSFNHRFRWRINNPILLLGYLYESPLHQIMFEMVICFRLIGKKNGTNDP
jgi:hypothetical protein